MKLTEALKDVTTISAEDPSLNLKNYMRSLNYIDNLYRFMNTLKESINMDKCKFLPTFKDCYIAESLGIAALTEENELRLLKVKSPDFIEDELYQDIYDRMTENLCQNVMRDGAVVTFYLK